MSTKVTLTIRVIRNFEYRTVKNIVLHDLDTSTTVGQLRELILKHIQEQPGFAPFRTVHFDTLKKYTTYQGYKPNNLIINLEHDDDWHLKDNSATLASLKLENEVELSFFNWDDYLKYKNNPQIKWY